MQCKERVDLLETLRKSRIEAKEADRPSEGRKADGTVGRGGEQPLPKIPSIQPDNQLLGWVDQRTLPAATPPAIVGQGPPLPQRPPMPLKQSSEHIPQRPSMNHTGEGLALAPTVIHSSLPYLAKQSSRSPSPEKRTRLRTTLRPSKEGKGFSKSKDSAGRRIGPPAASTAAGLAWDSISRASGHHLGQSFNNHTGSTLTLNSSDRDLLGGSTWSRRESAGATKESSTNPRSRSFARPSPPLDPAAKKELPRPSSYHDALVDVGKDSSILSDHPSLHDISHGLRSESPKTTITKTEVAETKTAPNKNKPGSCSPMAPSEFPSYRNEYPEPSSASKALAQASFNKPSQRSELSALSLPSRQRSPPRKARPPVPPSRHINRRPVPNTSSSHNERQDKEKLAPRTSSESGEEHTSSSRDVYQVSGRTSRKKNSDLVPTGGPTTPPSSDRDTPEGSLNSNVWEERVAYIKKHLPKGVDENATKQIFNEIVVHGDEVHWDDIAGLDVAKKALKEAVVYPFLRPDLFMGLREPARGMLLFGPPGTGKTMLARAVATESRSTFFAISASSLTSKWLGESEKLVRALFALARALAPSIIFVDEIDSLLSSRGGSSEHESTRRIKTEFLIQWSDLQRAAAGKEQTDKEKREGDASRVLVLAATNMPWAIDEAARRRFVRRQYIPLPEGHVRATQLRTLLGHQKHELNEQDIAVLVELTEGMLMISHP